MSKPSSEWLKSELHSSYSIFTATLLVDGAFQLMSVYNGDLSQSALMALATVAVRSLVKTLFIKIRLVPSTSTQTVGTDSKIPVHVTKSTSVKRK